MAVAGNVTPIAEGVTCGRRWQEWLVTETAVSSTAEYSIPIGWETWTILLCDADRTAGTGTTVQPLVGRATGCAGADYIDQVLTAADHVVVQWARYGSGNKMFVQSKPNSAVADHTIVTRWLIAFGVV